MLGAANGMRETTPPSSDEETSLVMISGKRRVSCQIEETPAKSSAKLSLGRRAETFETIFCRISHEPKSLSSFVTGSWTFGFANALSSL